MKYVQCEIRNGDLVDVRWLPENKADKSPLRIQGKEPEEGWIVTAKYEKRDEEKLLQARDAFREFRHIEIAGRRSYKD